MGEGAEVEAPLILINGNWSASSPGRVTPGTPRPFQENEYAP
jgi:hypothetical protein